MTTIERLREHLRLLNNGYALKRSALDELESAFTELEALQAELAELKTHHGRRLTDLAALQAENAALKSAIRQTLEENAHLADGDNCTLKLLKKFYETIQMREGLQAVDFASPQTQKSEAIEKKTTREHCHMNP